jgi:COP9 signalosome complex subunit 5
VNTLSSSPLLGNGDYVAGQISDLGTLQCHYFLCDNLFWFYIILIECPVNVIFCNYEYLNWEIFFVAAEKLEQAENQLAHSRFGPMVAPTPRKKEVSDCFFICLLQCTLSNYWNFFIESFRWIIQVFHLFI